MQDTTFRFKEATWKRLLRINRIIETIYHPFAQILLKGIITRLPFSKFYFRPCYLNELYMALKLWEPYVRETLKALIKSRERVLFVDVGAHIGYYVTFVSDIAKDCFVVAIEPDDRNLRILKMNINANKNVLVYNFALGSNGFYYLHPKTNPLYTQTSKIPSKFKIPSMSLDTLYENLRKKIGNLGSYQVIVKIDVEGRELDIIRNGLKFLKEVRPCLIIESWPSSFDKLRAHLKRLKYRSYYLFKHYYLFVSETSKVNTQELTNLKNKHKLQ